MAQARTWVGLDVHAAKVVAAVVGVESGELRVQRLPGRTAKVVEFCAGLPGPVRVSYEAGPTGFGLARALEQTGIGCVVAAPGKIARPASDRVKTDRRDAELLVRLLMAGQLSAVRVPSVREEACRDLVRAREDVRGDLMRARHRVGKLLLRHDQRFEGNNWTGAHRQWLNQVQLADPVAQAVLLDAVGAVDALVVRRDALERQMAALVPDSPWAQTIGRLRCLRGIDTLTALGLAAEIGDFERFERPEKLMSFLGLVPSERSSGDQRRQGAITKSGSEHARRLLVEAAWHYRRRPSRGRELERRKTASRSTSARSAGRLSAGCIAPGSASTPSAASGAPWSRSPSPASSQGSAGRPPPPPEHRPTAPVGRGGGGTRGPSRQRIRDSAMSHQPSADDARS